MYEENMMTVTKSDLSAENSNAKTQNSNQETQNSNGDLIYRDDALKPFCVAPDGTRIPEVDCDNFPVEFSVEFIKKHLLSLPSADTEWIPCSESQPAEADRPTGEWKGYNADNPDWLRKDGTPIFLVCDKCHDMVLNNSSTNWNYCPNCGARMKGGDDE